MAQYLAHTTRLEAVNTILSTIGGSPVSTLEGTGIEDVEIAVRIVDEVTRRVATTAYNWNTDENYELTPDVSGHIQVPTGALSVDPSDRTLNCVVRRHPTTNQLSLWNKDDKTWSFENPVEVNIVWGTPFEDLPEEARDYILLSAGRTFQQRYVGSQVLDRYSQEDEFRARAKLNRTELRSRDFNLFRSNPSLANFSNRRY
jgi:hypothetical protein